MMAGVWWGLVLLALVGMVKSENSCSAVYSQMRHCLDDGDLEITCPAKHWILIKSTTYYVSTSSTCPPSGTNNDCIAPGIVSEAKTSCNQQQTCSVSIPKRSTSICPGTNHYVWVQYQCEPLQNENGNARAIDLDNTYSAEAFTGTLVHVDSHPLGLLGMTIKKSDHACAFEVPAGIDVFMRTPIFLKNGSPSSSCNQKVRVWDDTDSFNFCVQQRSENVTCSDKERTFYITYETTNENVEVIFLLQVYVPYESNGLTITCGLGRDEVPFTTTTAVTTKQPATTTAAEEKDDATTTAADTTTDASGREGDTTTDSSGRGGDTGAVTSAETSWKIPIIIGMVCTSVLIMIVVILIVCIRYRNDQEKDPIPDDVSDRPSNYHFITEVYIDGDHKSQLVLDKKPNSLMRM